MAPACIALLTALWSYPQRTSPAEIARSYTTRRPHPCDALYRTVRIAACQQSIHADRGNQYTSTMDWIVGCKHDLMGDKVRWSVTEGGEDQQFETRRPSSHRIDLIALMESITITRHPSNATRCCCCRTAPSPVCDDLWRKQHTLCAHTDSRLEPTRS